MRCILGFGVVRGHAADSGERLECSLFNGERGEYYVAYCDVVLSGESAVLLTRT